MWWCRPACTVVVAVTLTISACGGGSRSSTGSGGAGSGGRSATGGTGTGGSASGGTNTGGDTNTGGSANTGGGVGTGGRASGGASSGGSASGGRGTGGTAGSASGGGGPGGGGACVTSVSGVVLDPAGKVPLYNAMIFSPTTPLAPIEDGASCLVCPQATSDVARSDAMGHFRLDSVPAGTNVPLVIQIGKWRRQIMVPNVVRCTDNAITDLNLTRLPRNRSEGHIPRIALATGGADALECLLRKVGLDDSEFTLESGEGRVNLFAGGTTNGMPMNGSSAGTSSYSGGGAFTNAETWWEGGLPNLIKYDIVLLSCEGVENPTNKSMAAREAMRNYADAGGRVFMSHWQNFWIEHGAAPWSMVANFRHQADPANPFQTTIDQSFPKGMALAQWLLNVGASVTLGELTVLGAKRTVTTVRTPTQRWIYNGVGNAEVDQYLSFTTPYGTGTCGEVVFSDLHVSGGSSSLTDDDSDVSLPFPTGCRTTDLSPQEKVLEFMLFDLLQCL